MKYFIIFFLTICINSFGQNQANNWYFGNGVGLNFNGGCIPTVMTDGAINGKEGCTTISDESTGQLLFYTNSEYVWNRNHVIMPAGNLVPNGYSITQSVVVRKPSFTSIYYIITSEVQGSSGNGLQFHCVDMNLNGGLGGLIFKDSLLYSSPLTEKLTLVRHSNGNDIWLIAHKYNSNKFLSFLITSAGISLVPVISQIGKVHSDPNSLDPIGELKASPDGTKLALVTYFHPNIELFDFDKSTGQLSNLITLPELGVYDSLANKLSGLYGLSFSSNSNVLYASSISFPAYGLNGKIIQYDISSNDFNTINNSRINIFSSPTVGCYSLKLAPNRKIYVAHDMGSSASDYIGVIDFPDTLGFGCNYADSGLFLNGKVSSWGLNNLMEYGNYCDSVSGFDEKSDIKYSGIKIYPNPSNHYFTIEFDNPNNEKLILLILDSYGRELKKVSNIECNKIIFEREKMRKGLYFIQLLNGWQVISTGKLVLE